MDIQTNHANTLRTPKVKCLQSREGYAYVLAGLYNGEVQQLTVEEGTPVVKKTTKISEVPVRTIAFNLRNYQIFAGTDEGNVVILDSENLNIINVIQAHDDFVRSIAVNEQENCFLTSSDDNCVKLFNLKDFTLINLYKDSKHYVMDVKFDNVDKTIFFTASLDGKVRKYSIYNTQRIDTFYCRPEKSKSFKTNTKKGLKNVLSSLRTSKTVSFNTFNNLSGLNSMEFINKDCFVTVNDDGYITIYDKNRNATLNMMKIHNGHINTVKMLKEGIFATVSNDGTMKIFNEMLKLESTIYSNFKIWDFCVFGNYVITGTDEEYLISHIVTEKVIKKMASNRIFTLKNKDLYCQKAEDMVEKHLGSIDGDLIDFVVSENGKLIAVVSFNGIVIYGFLGLRKKYEIPGGRSIVFKSEHFYVVSDKGIKKYNFKFEEEESYDYENVESILDVNNEGTEDELLLMIDDCVVHCLQDEVIKKFSLYEEAFFIKDIESKNTVVCMYDDERTLFWDKKATFESNFKLDEVKVVDNVVFFTSEVDLMYGFVHQQEFHAFSLNVVAEELLSVFENNIYLKDNVVKVDFEFIQFQKDVVQGKNVKDAKNIDGFRQKAIAFYEKLNRYEDALEITSNENQMFDLLLKLNKFDDAFQLAKSPAKLNKIGERYVEEYRKTNDKVFLEKASCAFKKAGNIANLFYTDAMSSKKHLDHVCESASATGQLNLALLSAFICKNYVKCGELFKNTKFEKMFYENFLNKK